MNNILRVLIVFVFIAIIILIVFISRLLINHQPDEYIALNRRNPETLSYTERNSDAASSEVFLPTKISIEKLDINSPIERVGITDEKMSTPSLPGNVGWYEYGVAPGEIGSAVLDGHVNWKSSSEAAFTNLKNIAIGDAIEITNSNNEIIYFSVDTIKKYSFDDDTSEVFISNDGLAHLNLITCSGLWNSVMKSHELRLVVFATKI
jgi:sortase A